MANISIACPVCKNELQDENISGEFKLGTDNRTVTIYLEVYCHTCNAPSFFTLVSPSDMVNLEEVSNG
jgi:hypothetical protein